MIRSVTTLGLALVLILTLSFLGTVSLIAQVLPYPQSLRTVGEDRLIVGEISAPAGFGDQAMVLRDALARLGANLDLAGATTSGEKAKGQLRFVQRPGLGDEGYRIRPRPNGAGLDVAATTPQGAARAAATLLQLAQVDGASLSWSPLVINDAPTMPHRSFMVDMGRNPHPPEVLHRVVDLMWFFKLNYLQLHLTDDQLFSWPSSAFPKLTSPRAGWSRDDFVALENYAQARGVTIIPELEVPGHSSILRRTYPETFGKTPTELASRPKAQAAIETLIDEMLSVFPSTPYVHIGGDEAYGVPQDIQRSFINRLNNFVKSRGRQTIVWEGPRPGDGDNAVARDVMHICWRAVEFPPAQMLERGHDVIAAPWDPCYIVDHYPRTMYTAVDLERIYGWNPGVFAHVNPGMRPFHQPPTASVTSKLRGFCMPWWEGRSENLAPLCFPRMAALGTAAWNPRGRAPFPDFKASYEARFLRLCAASDIEPFVRPVASAASQRFNLAFRAEVRVSHGAAMPWFGPERLVNGIPNRFDHFLGYPTKPDPLVITLKLRTPAELCRIVVHERAVGGSHEVYRLLASEDGENFEEVGSAVKGSRGQQSFVIHRMDARRVSHLRIVTQGCEGLTFPSFSRLSEIEAFRY